jgi:hypothetical protein
MNTIQKIKNALHCAMQLGKMIAHPNRLISESADSTLIGAAALQRLSLEMMIEEGHKDVADHVKSLEESVYLALKEKHEIEKAHKAKVAKAAPLPPRDSFMQRPGRA